MSGGKGGTLGRDTVVKVGQAMSGVRTDSPYLAALLSDVHLSDNCPLARDEKDNWQDVQFSYLAEVRNFCNEHQAALVIGGDVFDKWKVSPELVNRTIEEFQKFNKAVYAVPGNHDLPLHNYADVRKSSYWTLVQAGVVQDIRARESRCFRHPKNLAVLEMHGFPWGCKIVPLERKTVKEAVTLAVCHAYVWSSEANAHPNARDQDNFGALKKAFSTYDAVLLGDNHKRFFHPAHKTPVLNPGAFVPRRSDETGQVPVFGALTTDGKIVVNVLHTDARWSETVGDPAKSLVGDDKVEKFIEDLRNETDGTLDFKVALLHRMQALSVPRDVKNLILRVIED